MLIKRLSKPQFVLISEISSIVIIGIITIELFFSWLIDSHYYYNVPFLLRFNTPFVFLIGPAIFFLVYSHIYPTRKWNKISLLHLLPFIGVIIYFLPLYFSSQTEKIEYIDQLYKELPFDSFLIGGLRRIHQLGYLTASIVLIRKANQLQLKRKVSQIIYMVLFVFGLFLFLDIYRYFFNFNLISGIVDAILLSFVAIYLVFNQLRNPQPIKLINSLNTSQVEIYKNQILETFAKEKVYLNPKASLDELANMCDLQKHHVSQTINQHMKTNFNELINTYRVKEAIRLLESEETSILTIKAIAEMTGFNTISSFNANFKKITGKSPKEFRA